VGSRTTSDPGGIVHGGAIATLVDIATGTAVFAGGDDNERPVTIEIKLDHLDAGEVGPSQNFIAD
jgi:acyl-coenzyme A thioesterase PaaI-like protein